MRNLAETHAVPTAENWAEHITTMAAQTVEAVIAVGGALLDAKAALPHGEWERLFPGHPQAVRRPLTFSSRTARYLMAVAKHPILSDRKHASVLPPSWATLAVLSRMAPPRLARAIVDGTIRPDMTRREVAGLRFPNCAPPPPLPASAPGPRPDRVSLPLTNPKRAAAVLLAGLSLAEAERFVDRLRSAITRERSRQLRADAEARLRDNPNSCRILPLLGAGRVCT